MAIDYGGPEISAVTSEDLSEKQFCGVTMETDGTITLGASAGEMCVGVLQNKPGAGGVARIRINGGTSPFKLGDTVEEGGELQVDTDGMFIAAAASDYVHGVALLPGVDGDVVPGIVVHYQKI
ncbi:MAG TPA: hypothetical protein VMX57_03920 [Planctomycetota bacterium]|nr:hypothetical protein [Planctomycetota bacterium]